MTQQIFDVPPEHRVEEFFQGPAVERVPEDGFWCYEADVGASVLMRLSVDVLERSVQTQVLVANRPVATTSHESATRLTIEGQLLRCEFADTECRTLLEIDASRGYQVKWWTLRLR